MFARPSTILYSELKNCDIENFTSGDVLLIKINIYKAQASELPESITTLTKVHKTIKNMK